MAVVFTELSYPDSGYWLYVVCNHPVYFRHLVLVMSSRLDRLFILLESGSSAATRKAAANQLGEVSMNKKRIRFYILFSIVMFFRCRKVTLVSCTAS